MGEITLYLHTGRLAVDSNKVATIDKIKRWGYLDKIKAEVNANNNIEVTSLIGANCVKALEPRELIASKNGGPYTFRTLLGWCIVGPCTVKINLRN